MISNFLLVRRRQRSNIFSLSSCPPFINSSALGPTRKVIPLPPIPSPNLTSPFTSFPHNPSLLTPPPPFLSHPLIAFVLIIICRSAEGPASSVATAHHLSHHRIARFTLVTSPPSHHLRSYPPLRHSYVPTLPPLPPLLPCTNIFVFL